MTATTPPGAYDASSITILSGLEPVRQRPGMYIGSTGAEGLHHLAHEVLDNAVDEALAGFCRRITVELLADGSCAVTDDGRGVPTSPMPDGRPAAEVVFTTLHAGAKFHDATYKVSGGLHGVGVSCVNALSEWLQLDIWRDGSHHRASFSRGQVTAPLARLDDGGDDSGAEKRGTRVHFLPDARIFREVLDFSYDALAWRLRELAFLNPGLCLEIVDHRGPGRRDAFQYDGGTRSFVAHLNHSRTPLHDPPLHIHHHGADGIELDAALQWTSLYAEDTHTFVNSIRTSEGGTHREGLHAALLAAIRQVAAELGRGGVERIQAMDVREGLTAVLALKVSHPEFGGQTKTRLTNPEARSAVQSVVHAAVLAALRADPALAGVIVQKAMEAARARRAARRAGEAARHQLPPEEATPEVYRDQFGERSKNWHASAVWITHDELLGRHGSLCAVPPDSEALDVCCGSGVVGNSFRGRVKKITGLDITPEMVQLARQRLDEVVQGTVYDIPFPEARFELVCNREVMHLMPDPMRMMSEVVRVLKPGGQFVVGQILPFGAADAAWMYRIFKKKQPLLYHMFQESDFEALLREAGLVDIEMHELHVWEDIDVWIDTYETSSLHRHEIRRLYHEAPAEARAIHPFRILPSGRIQDCWRWCIYSARKPGHLSTSDR